MTFNPGERVINSIGEHGTVVVLSNGDPFGFVAKSKMIPVRIDGMKEDEAFLHHAETLKREEESL